MDSRKRAIANGAGGGCAARHQARAAGADCGDCGGPLPTAAYHSRVDYRHHLVPDLLQVQNAPFYFGRMDRHEAERLLADRPEGTFLLRDSAQERHLFSVSFRRFQQTLHAGIEQHRHRFGFDPQDPAVFSADRVLPLVAHYQPLSPRGFFDPVLATPLSRRFVFSLKRLCRARVAAHCEYDQIGRLPLPATLASYLRAYHYREPVRTHLCEPR